MNATIVEGGQFYNDVPSVTMVDSSGVGKGGLLSWAAVKWFHPDCHH